MSQVRDFKTFREANGVVRNYFELIGVLMIIRKLLNGTKRIIKRGVNSHKTFYYEDIKGTTCSIISMSLSKIFEIVTLVRTLRF